MFLKITEWHTLTMFFVVGGGGLCINITISPNVCLIRKLRWTNFRNFCCLEITGINCLVCAHKHHCLKMFIRQKRRRLMACLSVSLLSSCSAQLDSHHHLRHCLLCLLWNRGSWGLATDAHIPESEREGQRARYTVVLWKLFWCCRLLTSLWDIRGS